MGRTRSPQLTLTKRQREVLDLVAGGYGNREIGEALALALDAAKWHVGELLSKFGVDSREELAARWKAERGSPLSRLAAPLGLLSAGGVLKAGVAVAAVVAGALLLLGRDSETAAPASLPPGIWVAQIVPGPEGDHTAPAPIRAFDAVAGAERSFGPAATYITVAWSPRGDRLAAIAVDFGSSAEITPIDVRIWDGSGEELGAWRPSSRSFPTGEFAWSPDGTRLAVVMNTGVAILNEDAGFVGEVRSTPAPNGGGGGSGSFGFELSPWSPDSGFFATQTIGLLLIASRDGAGGEYDLPPRGTGPFEQARFRGWTASDELSAILQSDTPEGMEYLGRLDGRGITWQDGRPFDWILAIQPDQQRLSA